MVRQHVNTKCESFFVTKCDDYYKLQQYILEITAEWQSYVYNLDFYHIDSGKYCVQKVEIVVVFFILSPS